ncbi:hypothetical protein PFISCL1PPCAC_26799, partial [Pristionchus fissidentatus]
EKVSGTPTPPHVSNEVEDMLRRNLNFSVDPCDDFYNYVCGNWMATHEIPSGKHVIYVGSDLKQNFAKKQKEFLEDTMNKPTSSAHRKMQDFYLSCLDTEYVERNNNADMISALKKLGPFPMMGESYNPTLSSFTEVLINISQRTVNPFVGIIVQRESTTGRNEIKVDTSF